MSIQELEYIKLILEIDPTTTVKEIAQFIRELRNFEKEETNDRSNSNT